MKKATIETLPNVVHLVSDIESGWSRVETNTEFPARLFPLPSNSVVDLDQVPSLHILACATRPPSSLAGRLRIRSASCTILDVSVVEFFAFLLYLTISKKREERTSEILGQVPELPSSCEAHVPQSSDSQPRPDMPISAPTVSYISLTTNYRSSRGKRLPHEYRRVMLR